MCVFPTSFETFDAVLAPCKCMSDAPRGWFKWQGAEARILLIISVSNDFSEMIHGKLVTGPEKS